MRRSAPRRTLSEGGSTLDARAAEAVTRFVRLLARCGCTPSDIATQVLEASRQVPKAWAHNAKVAPSAMDAAAHALTLWFSDPAYVDSSGNPRPLSLRGAERSLEALARRVDPALDVQEVLRHLLRRAVLQRKGTRYLPRDRVLSFRGSGSPYHSRSVQSLVAMLRTLEHNSEPRRTTPGWYEVFALNPRFPVSARAEFDARVRHFANRLLVQFDADMHRAERARKKGERTVRLGVGIYRFEEEPLPSEQRAGSRRRTKRKKGA